MHKSCIHKSSALNLALLLPTVILPLIMVSGSLYIWQESLRPLTVDAYITDVDAPTNKAVQETVHTVCEWPSAENRFRKLG